MAKIVTTFTEEQQKQFIDKYGEFIIGKCNIVRIIGRYVSLFRKGSKDASPTYEMYFGTCPFHFDNLVSLSVDPHTQTYHCSSCGSQGDVVDFLCEVEHCGLFDGYLIAASYANVDVYPLLKNVLNADQQLYRVDLCVRSGNSMNKGVGSVEELVKNAKAAGIDVMALCDEYSTSAFKQFAQTCLRNDITPILGVTINADGHRVVLIAKNKDGVREINELISNSKVDEYTGRFTNTARDVKKLTESIHSNLISIGLFDCKRVDGTSEEGFSLEAERSFIEKCCNYVGLHSKDSNIYLHLFNKKRVVVVSDSYYNNCSQKFLYDALENKHHEEEKCLKNNNDILRYYRFQSVFVNPMDIVNQIDFKNLFPQNLIYLPYRVDGEKFVKDVFNYAKKKFPKMTKDEQERLRKEAEGIARSGYCTLVDLAAKIASFIEENGERNRLLGTSNNSYLLYVLGINPINPMEWDCPYETFLGLTAEKQPDIDFGVSLEFKDKVDEHVGTIVGRENVAYPGMLEMMNSKEIADAISKYMNGPEFVEDTYEMAETKIFDLSNTAIRYRKNPFGLMLKPGDMSFNSYTPIKYLNEDDIYPTTLNSFFGFYDNFLKQDIRPMEKLSFISLLEKRLGLHFEDIVYDDPEVLSLSTDKSPLKIKQNLLTYDLNPFAGIEAFNSYFMTDVFNTCKPYAVEEYVKVCNMIHGTDCWSGLGNVLITEKGLSLSDLITSRDDIFNVLTKKYGIPRQDAFIIMEDARKGKGLKTVYSNLLIAHNVPDHILLSLQHVKYLFPKGHSVSYTLDALRLAYIKIHYPKEFYEAYFEAYDCLELLIELAKKDSDELHKLILVSSSYEESKRRTVASLIIEIRERGIDIYNK